MKKKEIISAAIGGTFFAVPYLALSLPILPSLAIGAAAYGAGKLVLDNDKFNLNVEDRSTRKILESAILQNKHILDMTPLIEEERMRKELNEIHDSVDKIIMTISKNPERVKEASNFFDYYLPITVRLVDRYDEIENQKLSSADSKKFLESTNEMVCEINKTYKKILSNLYKRDILDMDAEMKVFNSLLKSDGFNDAEFVIEKEDK